MCNYFPPHWNTLRRSKKKRTAELCTASCAARASRHHLRTDSDGVNISSLSATLSPVARLA